ncbi:T9SS type A sorting domain-containing protein [Flavobacterium ustbae]|uniref:T9SS type A sorting domain-containing protein n=1 Tax=Flavobacterium ustbae TaxID=2488790 RepID=UPI000F7A5A90|nr:T9SS type A sorting domain-containing protein [Flavobacterium ustbae]
MKKLFTLFILTLSFKSFSQLHLSTNSSIYAKNQVLYVGQNLNLNPNSNLYLRNDAQLVQGGNSASGNTGLGSLSVYQEGTSDNFDYNYWCSPVGTPSSASGNTNFGISLLSRPDGPIASSPATLLPTGSYDGTASPLAIASHWIYKLINANNYSQWISVGTASTIAPGEGFTMKGTSGTDMLDPAGLGVANNPGGAQRYDFRGKPNNGNITVSLGTGSATLTGNPYPSVLHLNAFLLDPDNRTLTGGTAYFWQQDRNVNSHYLSAYRGGYGSYSPINTTSEGLYVPPTFNAYNQDGTVNPGPGGVLGTVQLRRYAPIGQGFLLNGTANGNVIFKNAHRVFLRETSGLSQFEKKAQKQLETEEVEPLSYFRLNTIINNQFTRQLALAFLDEATDGADSGIDALNMTLDLPEDVNFWIEDKAYLIQGVNFDPYKKIPLSVKASKASTLKFHVSEAVNIDTSQALYLYDKSDDSYHEIRNASYELLVATGTYTDRFFIAFTDQTLGIEENPDWQSFVIYQDSRRKNIKAANPQAFTIKSFTLFDMTGRAVILKKDLNAEPAYIFPTDGLSDGVYIAEFLTDENQRISKKVIISNSGNK